MVRSVKEQINNITTEGWLELFLTASEKRTFSIWEEKVRNRSISHRITARLVHFLASLIPESVAPNVVTLSGLCCLAQAWYVTERHGPQFPRACTYFSVLNVVIFYLSSSIDVVHAERIRQRTALGDLFKYCCDCCSTVFLASLAVYCLGGGPTAQWYAVQGSQLVLFIKHLSAFHRNAGLRYNVLTGPGEVILIIVVLLGIRATFGLDWFIALYQATVHQLVKTLDRQKIVTIREDHLEKIYDADPVELGGEAVMTAYYAAYIIAVTKTLLLSRKVHGWSRFGLLFSLLARLLPAIIMRATYGEERGVENGGIEDFGGKNVYGLENLDIVCDGLFMAVLTSDVTLAKMAGREVHPCIVLMSICAILPHPVVLCCVLTYYIAVFADLCSYLNMPLLTTCRNVYCDGIYDLCHIGHKTCFKNALRHGNRLFVGVVGDKDASSYKRPPVMTHDERCLEVEACKSVTKVIRNAPCFGLTQEFLDEHQIHIVAYGMEYLERHPDPKDDIYYGYVRKEGVARPIPRFDGLSTSDLITRIQSLRPASERNDQ